ncbi:NF041680 family putative transposase, partial [Streptomyces sp. NPDC014685]|uniref:NF041680 family putative transposase n=1 Tax=Streptomyces sp. NPDC014685 TaxID=3364881 RepID=UPI0036F530B6
MSLEHQGVLRDALAEVSRFRTELYACLTAWDDALFELCDALLCTDGPVRTLVDLVFAPEHRRGHGALYGGLNQCRIDVARLRRALAGVPLPRAVDGRPVLAVDVSPWLRPDANTCADRPFCHTFGRGEGKHQMVPGWPYSIVAALENGRTSWTAVLDAVRLEPGAAVAAVTTEQIREVVERLVAAGQWKPGDPEVLVVLDAGYDAPRIAHLPAGLPVEILGRLRSDRVMRRPTPLRVYDPKGGRPPKHGGEFVFGDPATWGVEQAVTATDTRLYGRATAQAWDRLHPRLTRRAAWLDHDGPLPIIESTVIRPVVEKLPSGGVNKPVWLWWSGTAAIEADVDRCWQSFLRRFAIEHTFRLFKQTLGWTRPRLRSSEAAERWTWLVIAQCREVRACRSITRRLDLWRGDAEACGVVGEVIKGGQVCLGGF